MNTDTKVKSIINAPVAEEEVNNLYFKPRIDPTKLQMVRDRTGRLPVLRWMYNGTVVKAEELAIIQCAHLVGRPLSKADIMHELSGGVIVTVRYEPIFGYDPVLPVPLLFWDARDRYPMHFSTCMRYWANHLSEIESTLGMTDHQIKGWYGKGKELIEEVLLAASSQLQLDRESLDIMSHVMYTTLSQPKRYI